MSRLMSEPEQQPAGTPVAPIAAASPENGSQAGRPIVFFLITAILILGAIFRFTGVNWDAFTHLHPDERFLTLVTDRLERPGSLLTYLRTSESPLNPYNKGEGFYVYGNFPMTATFYAGAAAEWLRLAACPVGSQSIWCTNDLTGYNGVHLVGRVLSGLLDLVSVLFTFFIGRRLFGRAAGLLAAFFLATAVMAIQQSHFYTMDNWAAALTTITLFAAVRASEDGGRFRWWLVFGLFLGLTMASRINVAPLALMAGAAGLIWLVRAFRQSQTGEKVAETGRPAASFWRYVRGRDGWFNLQLIIVGGMTAALVSIVVFRLAMPYAFADSQIARQSYLEETGREPGFFRVALQSIVGLNPRWLSNMEEIQRLQAPEAAFPPALQWVNRTPILFPLTNMVLYGMGPLAGLLAWIGLAVAAWRIARGRPDWLRLLIPAGWTAFYFLFIGTRWVKSVRYFLPIYPTLFILAGWFLVFAYRQVQARRVAPEDARPQGLLPNTVPGWGVVLLGTAAVVTSALWANAFVEIYRQPLTRVAASDWIYEHVPSAATVLYRAGGVDRQLQLPLTGIELIEGAPPIQIHFSLPEDGEITGVRLAYAGDGDGQAVDSETIRVALNGSFGSANVVQGEKITDLGPGRTAVEIPLAPTPLPAEVDQVLSLSAGPGGKFRLETSVISSEHWDDALPARGNNRDPYSQYYRGLSDGQITTTFPDNDPQKRANLARWLDEADYVVLSSQRSLWSLPRLPMTYPLMIRTYEALFSGELGFDLAGQFHGDIRLGPLAISDTGGAVGWGEQPQIGWPPPGALAAEEAFSVYDHPPVWIFRKTDRYSPANTRSILEAVDTSLVVVMNPLEATRSVNGLLLSPEQRARQEAGGTFADLFNPDGLLNTRPGLAVVAWWLLVVALGWLAFPLTFTVFSGLADRGFALARILSLLVISWFAWMMASLEWLDHTAGTLWLGTLLLAGLSGWLGWRKRRELAAFVRDQRRLILLLEAIGLLLFVLQLIIRLGNPDAWHVIWGGEKPMDMAYFTAVLKSTTFPPYDPWFAGGYLNYYYYGFVYVGSITKMLGIVPAVAYNLILPMLYSFTGLAAFSLAYNLAVGFRPVGFNGAGEANSPIRRGVAAGSAAAVLAVLLGNLKEIAVVFTAWERASSLAPDAGGLLRVIEGGWRVVSGAAPAPIYPGDWFWTATRAIAIPDGEVAPITEFPFFTFLYGDLHAHMIALPLALLALGWSLATVLQSQSAASPGSDRSNRFIYWVVGGLAIGVLYPTNSWDYPTYLVLGLLALIYAGWRRDGLSLKAAATSLYQGGWLAGLSLLLFWPFWANFGTGYGALRLWEGSKTGVGDYLSIHGLFLFILLPWLFVDLKLWMQTRTTRWLQERAGVTAAGVGGGVLVLPILLFGLIRGIDVLPIALLLVLFAGLLSLRADIDPARRIINVFVSAAVALTLVVELVVLDGDIGRMNTVFKFYLQVWLLLSIAAGVVVVWLWEHMQKHWGPAARSLWQGGLIFLILMAALYPLLATRAKWMIRENRDIAPITLDGMRHMDYVSYGEREQTIVLKDDAEAIRWIQRHISGSPVMAEAFSGNPYRSAANRVAMYTGLPAVIGWDWHQRQQRNTVPSSFVSQRVQDVDTLFSTTDTGLAGRILQKYGVRYIYSGQLEIVTYGLEGILKFDRMAAAGQLREVYRNPGVRIYEVINPPPTGERGS